MDLKTTAVTRQWLSSDYVVTPTDMNTTIALQQRNSVFCAIRAEILQAGPVSCCSQLLVGESVGEPVRELLMFSRFELLL
jgi:hypothetical protein